MNRSCTLLFQQNRRLRLANWPVCIIDIIFSPSIWKRLHLSVDCKANYWLVCRLVLLKSDRQLWLGKVHIVISTRCGTYRWISTRLTAISAVPLKQILWGYCCSCYIIDVYYWSSRSIVCSHAHLGSVGRYHVWSQGPASTCEGVR
jgi:hypothetical protein